MVVPAQQIGILIAIIIVVLFVMYVLRALYRLMFKVDDNGMGRSSSVFSLNGLTRDNLSESGSSRSSSIIMPSTSQEAANEWFGWSKAGPNVGGGSHKRRKRRRKSNKRK